MKSDAKNISPLIIGLIVFVAILGIWISGWILMDLFIKSSDDAKQTHEAARGLFGDKFGAINALFSGFAFAGIVLTMVLQKAELSLQRSEIHQQNSTLKQQRFENTLFQLLNLLSEITRTLRISGNEGKEAISYFVSQIQNGSREFAAFKALSQLNALDLEELRKSKVVTESLSKKLEKSEISNLNSALETSTDIVDKFLLDQVEFHRKLIDSAYMNAHERSLDGLSHYFRTLFHIYKFIDQSDLIPSETKYNYGKIVRAQLSNDELIAILYNALARDPDKQKGLEFGFPEMTNYVVKYKILKNINQRELIHPIHLNLATNQDPAL